MKIEIEEDGIVYCNGIQCPAQAQGCALCVGCYLKHLFDQIYENCDPLQCRKILCAGCEFKRYTENHTIQITL